VACTVLIGERIIREERMIKGLFGPSSLTAHLRSGLDEMSVRHTAIARRVSRALTASSTVHFGDQLTARARARKTEADLQKDMTKLADTQLRYETDARLLQQAYARFHAAVRERA
jgi:hypothetical protein